MQKKVLFVKVVVMSLYMVLAATLAFAESVPRMSTDDLKSQLGNADLIVLDVRAGWDWSPAENKIAGAERVDPRALGQWLGNYPKEQTIVLYCA